MQSVPGGHGGGEAEGGDVVGAHVHDPLPRLEPLPPNVRREDEVDGWVGLELMAAALSKDRQPAKYDKLQYPSTREPAPELEG